MKGEQTRRRGLLERKREDEQNERKKYLFSAVLTAERATKPADAKSITAEAIKRD